MLTFQYKISDKPGRTGQVRLVQTQSGLALCSHAGERDDFYIGLSILKGNYIDKDFPCGFIDKPIEVRRKNKELVILEDEMRKVAKNLYISTDDGSYGFNGRVTDCLLDLVNNQGKKYDHAVVIGPMIMMKFMSMLTKELKIKTTVSLNPIMVDGTGMCGACRVTVGDQVKFACVDGPEFDGHLVNFDESMRRQALYKSEEGRELLKIEEGDTHHREGCGCGGHK